MQKLIIYGCGGHARSVLDILLNNQAKYDIIFVDENARENEHIMQFPVLPEYQFNGDELVFAAVGDNHKRKQIYESVAKERIISIQSARAYSGKNTVIGAGALIGEGVHLGPDVKIGEGSVINTGCIIEHETEVGAYTHIAPGSVVCGRSHIGNQVMLGAKSTVIDKVSVCDHVVVGAGGVVTEDIATPGVYVGIPVRKIK